MDMRLLSAFLALLLLVSFGFALSVSVVSESHSIINHEIIFAVNTIGDATDTSKTWDLNIFGLIDKQIQNPVYEMQSKVTEKQPTKTPLIETCNEKKIGLDTNAYACWSKDISQGTTGATKLYDCQSQLICTKTTYTDSTINVDKNVWLSLGIVNKTISYDRTSLNLPIKIFAKNNITLVKVKFEVPITATNWGSSGTWSMNPAGWWNVIYTARYPIKISGTHTAITTNHTLFVNYINSSGWACGGDNNKVALVYQAGTPSEVSMDILGGTCGSTDLNIAFKSRTDIPANIDLNGTDTNGYFLYVTTATVSNPDRNKNAVYPFFDDFSDADYTTNPTWTTAGSWLASSKYLASNNANETSINTPNTALVTMSADNLAVELKMYRVNGNRVILDLSKTANSSDFMYRIFCNTAEGCNLGYYSGGGYVLINYTGTFSASTWNQLKLTRTTAGDWQLYLNGTSLGTANNTLWADANYIFLNSFDTAGGSFDDIKLYRYPSTLPTYFIGAGETSVTDANITFNVYRSGTSTNLTGITADWNVNAYDVSAQNSPFTQDVNIGNYAVTFSRTGYDNNTAFLVVADSNKTYTIYLTDSTAPTTIATGCGAGWNNTDQNITFGCSDSGSGCNTTAFKIDGGAWQTTGSTLLTTDLNHQIDYNSTDVAGNIETTKTIFCAVDKTAPTYSSVDNNGVWKITNFNINFNGLNFGVSGKANAQYRVDGGSWTSFPSDYNVPITTDGNKTVDANFTDNANNSLIVSNVTALLDKTAPSVGATTFSGFAIFGSFINGIGTILGGLATDITSGINTALCEYTINGGGTWLSAVWNTDHCEKTGVIISNGTIYDANTRITDVAGNTGTGTGTGAYTGDTTAPTTTPSGCGAGWNNTDQNITLSCNDGAGAGCASTRYRVDSGSWQTANTLLLSTDGNHQVDYNSTDNVQNNEAIKTIFCAVDKTAPTTTDNASNAWSASDETVTLTPNDSTSGIKQTYYCIDTVGSCIPTTSGTSASVTCGAGNNCLQYVRYLSIDNADNNETIKQSAQTRIDKNVPETIKTGCESASMSPPQDVNLTCNDPSGSGCSATAYRIDLGAWLAYTTTLTFSADGNHRIDYNSIDSVLNIEATKTSYCDINNPAPVLHPAPDINVTAPIGQSYNKSQTSSISVTFNVQSTDSNTLYIDLNYSNSSTEGTGTEVLILESTGGAVITCDDYDFSNSTNCTYSLNIGLIADGNYFVLMKASTDFNSAFNQIYGDFNLFTPSQIVNSSQQIPRYINPESEQRDTNRYFNPTSALALTDSQKQTVAITDSKNLIFLFGIMLLVTVVIIGVVIWRKR